MQYSIASLPAEFLVIIFDTRDIGRTDAPGGPYSMEMFADDLAGLMDALKLSTASILVFLMGGQVALQFALKYPTRVSKLIIAASCAQLNKQIGLFVDTAK